MASSATLIKKLLSSRVWALQTRTSCRISFCKISLSVKNWWIRSNVLLISRKCWCKSIRIKRSRCLIYCKKFNLASNGALETCNKNRVTWAKSWNNSTKRWHRLRNTRWPNKTNFSTSYTKYLMNNKACLSQNKTFYKKLRCLRKIWESERIRRRKIFGRMRKSAKIWCTRSLLN